MNMTRRAAILTHLEERGERGETGLGLLMNGGGVDYRKRISELRRDGYPIEGERVPGKPFKRYYLRSEYGNR